MPNKTLPALALVVMCASCGPLVPLPYEKGKNNQLVQTIETREATVWLQFLEKQYSHYVFDLEIENHGPQPMSFAPQNISFYASSKKFPTPIDTANIHAVSAANSTLIMKRQFANSPTVVEDLYYKKVKSKRAGAVLFAVIGAALVIYDAAKDSEDSSKETWTKKDAGKSIGRDLLVSMALTASDVAHASADEAVEESKYVPYELFPECSIQPGKSVRGKIFIYKEASNRYSRVIIPIGGFDYIFDLKR